MATILYVEDYPGILEAVQDIFRFRYPDNTLLTARSVEKALAILPEDVNSLKAVFTDGNLINSFGWNLAKKLRKKGYTGPIYYTGNARIPSEEAWEPFTSRCDKCGSDFRKTIEQLLA